MAQQDKGGDSIGWELTWAVLILLCLLFLGCTPLEPVRPADSTQNLNGWFYIQDNDEYPTRCAYVTVDEMPCIYCRPTGHRGPALTCDWSKSTK